MTRKALQLTYGELYFLNRSWPETINCKTDVEQKRWGILETVRQKIKTIFEYARENYTGAPVSVDMPEYAIVELKWYLEKYYRENARPHLTSETILSKLNA